MKILKPGVTEDPQRKKSTEHYQDITCDKCGKSTRDSMDMNFEYAEIEACWGFCSRKDAQHHTAQLCEDCYDAIGLKPKVHDHFGGSDQSSKTA